MKDVLLLVKKRSAERSDWQTAEYDAQRIEIIIEELHAITRRLLAANKHSRQYLFQLFRRYASLFWEDFQALSNSSHVSSEWFVEIVKAASSLILRCSRGDEPWEWIEEEGVKGIDFRDVSPDEFIVLAQLFALGQLWYEAKVRYRFACKGFRRRRSLRHIHRSAPVAQVLLQDVGPFERTHCDGHQHHPRHSIKIVRKVD